MKFVTKRSFLMKLIISIFLVTFIFNNIMSSYSYGAGLVVSLGGSLIQPLCGLGGVLLCAVNGLISLFLGGTDTFADLMKQRDEQNDPQFRKFAS